MIFISEHEFLKTEEKLEVIGGKKYNIKFTYNKPSEKAIADFVKEIVDIYK